ncbi:MAG: hypothetical protein JXA82_16120 [Sedimentisphaerales bacterium]|nr:hypothetical protein [Sedimentisphaerales bacterium]
MGWWSEIKPLRLGKKDRNHPWIFIAYHESPSQREDNQWYTAFLFRNKERNIFGMKEIFDLVHEQILRELATRVVKDGEFRKAMISNNPDLSKMWKGR